MDVRYRFATLDDVALLAVLNARLIRDEGHRNTMTESRLQERMAGWLKREYRAVLFEAGGETVGYALYRSAPDFVHLRQLFVAPEFRRHGIARAALEWLHQNVWRGSPRVRIEVLVGNDVGLRFWRSVGFGDYSITMEREL